MVGFPVEVFTQRLGQLRRISCTERPVPPTARIREYPAGYRILPAAHAPPHNPSLGAGPPQKQLESMLALLDNVCRPATDSQLSQDQYDWCQRLSKALRPDTLLSGKEDPLQLLRAWVTPAIWQRLRLRFERRRTHPPPLKSTHPHSMMLETAWTRCGRP